MHRNSFVLFEPDYFPDSSVQVSSLHLPDSLLIPRLRKKPNSSDVLTKALYSISPILKPQLVGDRCIKVECSDPDGLVDFAVLHNLGLAHLEGQRILMFGDETPEFSSETGSWYLSVSPKSGLLKTLQYTEQYLQQSNNDFLVIRDVHASEKYVQARPNTKHTWLVEYRDGDQDSHFQLVSPNVQWAAFIMRQWLDTCEGFFKHPWCKLGYDFVLFEPDTHANYTSVRFTETPLAQRYYSRKVTSRRLQTCAQILLQRIREVQEIELFDVPHIRGDRCLHISVAQSNALNVIPVLFDIAIQHGLGLLDLFRHLIVMFGDEDPRFVVRTPQWIIPGVSFSMLQYVFAAAERGCYECEPKFELKQKGKGENLVAKFEYGFWTVRKGRSIIDVKTALEAADVTRRWLVEQADLSKSH